MTREQESIRLNGSQGMLLFWNVYIQERRQEPDPLGENSPKEHDFLPNRQTAWMSFITASVGFQGTSIQR